MFKKFLEKIGKKQLFWSTKGETNTEIIDYGNFFNQVRTALILMPEQLDNFSVAINRHQDLAKLMPETRFSVFIREQNASLIPNDLQNNTIRLTENDLTPIGVPTRRFLGKIAENHYDVIIDLNPDFDLVSTYVCKKAKAKLSICLCHPQREPFYNLQFCAPESDTIDQKIDMMVKYISQFLASGASSNADLQPA